MTLFTWTLNAGWILTTDRPESTCGKPVLVNVYTQQAFGSADYISSEGRSAGEFALHLANASDLETTIAAKGFAAGRGITVGWMVNQ